MFFEVWWWQLIEMQLTIFFSIIMLGGVSQVMSWNNFLNGLHACLDRIFILDLSLISGNNKRLKLLSQFPYQLANKWEIILLFLRNRAVVKLKWQKMQKWMIIDFSKKAILFLIYLLADKGNCCDCLLKLFFPYLPKISASI